MNDKELREFYSPIVEDVKKVLANNGKHNKLFYGDLKYPVERIIDGLIKTHDLCFVKNWVNDCKKYRSISNFERTCIDKINNLDEPKDEYIEFIICFHFLLNLKHSNQIRKAYFTTKEVKARIERWLLGDKQNNKYRRTISEEIIRIVLRLDYNDDYKISNNEIFVHVDEKNSPTFNIPLY